MQRICGGAGFTASKICLKELSGLKKIGGWEECFQIDRLLASLKMVVLRVSGMTS